MNDVEAALVEGSLCERAGIKLGEAGSVLAGLALLMSLFCPGCAAAPDRPPDRPDASSVTVDDPAGVHRTLERDLRAGFLTPDQAEEIERQRQVLERRRPELAAGIEAGVVAVAGNQIFVAESPAAALAQVDAKLAGALVYMESGADWIYGWAFSQSSLADRIEFWDSNGGYAPETLRDLAAQRDAVEGAVAGRPAEKTRWFAHFGEKLYSGRNRAELVGEVAKEHPDALVYCFSPELDEWDAIPAGLAYGDAFQDLRNMTATAIEVGSGSDPHRELIKADWSSAAPITTFDGGDLSGIDVRYRGILVSTVYPWGHRGAVGLISDLHLRMKLAGGTDATWAPSLVLLSRRSIIGLDLCNELAVFPQPTMSSTQIGGRSFLWTRAGN